MRSISHSVKSKMIHVLLGFGCCIFISLCDNKHTFGKQMPTNLALLLGFSIKKKKKKNVDGLDNNCQIMSSETE